MDYQYGWRSRKIIVPVRDGQLVMILQNNIGNISYDNNRFVLKQIFISNVNVTTMTLLEKIVEDVLVRKYQENDELNRR